MQELKAGKELIFIGITLTDINQTWREEVSYRCGNFPEDYKKMLTTIDTHKLLKLEYKVGKLRVKTITKEKVQGYITQSENEEELGSTLINIAPGRWLSQDTEFIEYKYFKENLKDILGSGLTFLEDLINKKLISK